MGPDQLHHVPLEVTKYGQALIHCVLFRHMTWRNATERRIQGYLVQSPTACAVGIARQRILGSPVTTVVLCHRRATRTRTLTALKPRLTGEGPVWMCTDPKAVSLYWRDDGCPLGLDKERDEFGRFGGAGVLGNDVNVIRIFIESFSGLQGEFWSAFDLHDDRTLNHIDENVGIVTVLHRRCPWRIFDQKHGTFLFAA